MYRTKARSGHGYFAFAARSSQTKIQCIYKKPKQPHYIEPNSKKSVFFFLACLAFVQVAGLSNNSIRSKSAKYKDSGSTPMYRKVEKEGAG